MIDPQGLHRFRDRDDAGLRLAEALDRFRGRDVVVLGLPRGGMPVAWQVARRLDAPLDVFVVRKLGVPGHEELAFGALATGGVRVLLRGIVERAGLSDKDIAAVAARQQEELDRQQARFSGGREPIDVAGRTVLVVDDGLATGATMVAALQALRARGVGHLVAAVPVGAPDACDAVHNHADEVVCLQRPDAFNAVGSWYDDFSQTSDEEVRQLLASAPREAARPPPEHHAGV